MGGAWGQGARPSAQPPGPAATAFPDLRAAQQIPSTRRARTAAREAAAWTSDTPVMDPYGARADELHSRVQQWRRAGRATRDVVLREEVERPVDNAAVAPLADEVRGGHMASIVVRDHTQTAALGAWARTGKEAALEEPTSVVLETYAVHDPAEVTNASSVASWHAAAQACARTLLAEAGGRCADYKKVYAPLLEQVEMVLTSPVVLYRVGRDGAVKTVLDDWLKGSVLPPPVRSALESTIRDALTTCAVHLAYARERAQKEDALAVFTSEHVPTPILPTACALLALEIGADTDVLEQLVSAVDVRAWAQSPGPAWPKKRIAAVARKLSSVVGTRLGCYLDAVDTLREDQPMPYEHDAILPALLAILRGLWAAQTPDAPLSVHSFYVMATELGVGLAEYTRWVQRCNGAYFFCDTPCTLSLGTKVQIVAWEARQAKRQASAMAWQPDSSAHRRTLEENLAALSIPRPPPLASWTPTSNVPGDQGTLAMHVRRPHLVRDSMVLCDLYAPVLHRPLRVVFADEMAQDAGGLQKEYLLLLCEALCDPAAGLFRELDEGDLRGCLWFAPHLDESQRDRMTVLGVVLGLALFHQITLPLVFPLRVYAALLHGTTPSVPLFRDLNALAGVRPELAAGLRKLAQHVAEESSIEAMHLTWSVHDDGAIVALCPDGASIPVTETNRAAYVARRAEWELCDAVQDAQDALVHGFARVILPSARSPMALLTPSELETLLRGRNEVQLDLDALRASAAHVGFPAHTPRTDPIYANLDWFWTIWGQLPPDEQHALLGFITGSPRVPAMGPAWIGLRIQHVDDPYVTLGAPMEHIPWSSTCTSTLFLPVYPSSTALEAKIRIALQHTIGFGLG